MVRILIRNILSNWVGFAVQAATVFFLTPIVVHSLGDKRYGVWTLVTGLTGYYGLLDLGFRAGITQYLTRHLARKEFDKMNRVASSAVVVLALVGALIAVMSAIVSWLAPGIFTISPTDVAETRFCILVIGLTTAVQFVFFPYSAVFAATQRYDVANAVSVPLRLLMAGATVIVLKLGYGLMSLCIVTSVGDLVGCVIRWRVAYFILPQLRVSFRQSFISELTETFKFGTWNFLIQNATALRTYSSSVIIGIFMPMAALAYFNLAAGLVMYFSQLFTPMAMVFFPAVTHLDSDGDLVRLRTLYVAGSKSLILLAVPVALVGAFWADDFYLLWVGPGYLSSDDFTAVPLLYRVLLMAGVVTISQEIGTQVFLGMRFLGALAVLEILETLTFLILAVVFVRLWGLFGVALAALLPAVVFRGVARPLVICRLLDIRERSFLGAVYARPLVVGLIAVGVLVVLRRLGPQVYTWTTLALMGLAAAIILLPFIYFVGLNRAERLRVGSFLQTRGLAKQLRTRLLQN